MTSKSAEARESYTIEFEDRGKYLFAHIRGQRGTLEIATAYWTEIAQKTIASGLKNLLVIEEIPEMISIGEVHQLVSSLANLPVKDVRLAFVDLYPEHSSLNDFGILVGENRGFCIKSFETEEAASAWLQGK